MVFIYFTKNAGSYEIVGPLLWIAIDGYNERVHRKKQHASSIHTIPSTNIAFIWVFFFDSKNAMQYRSLKFTFCEATYSKQYRPRIVGSLGHK